MNSTLPMPLDPLGSTAAPPPPTRAAARPAVPGGATLLIEFSGSGSEYFRIWVVNLLLTLVTLGLYYPWAKVRRLRYFYNNTSVGGHPLDFHGNPTRMLRGFLLVGAMVALYSIAGQVSPGAGLVAFLITAAIWPALFRASQQFRLANTSWRGLRFHFEGDLAGAYRALLPLFVPGAVAIAAAMFGAPDASGVREPPRLIGMGVLAIALLSPFLFWNLKRYQHGNFALGQMQTELDTRVGSFYLLALKTAGVATLAALSASVAMGVAVGASLVSIFAGTERGLTPAAIVGMVVMLLAVYFSMLVVIVPYATARQQNLVWNATRSSMLEFESRLRFLALLRMAVKNWLLVLVTLGLYMPFAKIAFARLRLEMVSVRTLLPPDEMVATLQARADDASGDAAGDLFGIDIGL